MPFIAFAVLAVVLSLGWIAFTRSETAFTANHVSARGRQAPFVTEDFTLRGGTSNVAFTLWAPYLDNNWLTLDLSLIDATTGRVWDVPAEVSYYSGVDGGERWSEGRRSQKKIVANVPGGDYYLRIEPEAGTGEVAYALTVVRNPPLLRYLVIALVLLAVPVVLTGLSAYSFEHKRWSESDYPWSSSEDDE